jgi:alpha-beta hydrolase superfamily lysophospholipase
MKAHEIAASSWTAYLAKEQALFDDVRANVTDKLSDTERVPSNRYYRGKPAISGPLRDRLESFVRPGAGRSTCGAVVLVHGLTDSPYSLRHVARRYQQDGFVAVGIRLPGHGTVPAGLLDVEWEAWSEATRLAVREARRRAGPGVPLHLVGFSNGGALA